MKSNGALVCLLVSLLVAFGQSRAAENNVPTEQQSGCPGCPIDLTDSTDQDSLISATDEHYLVGGIAEKDVRNYKYIQLAEEALNEYKKEQGLTEGYHIIRIVNASEQVVAGLLTRIDFNAKFIPSNTVSLCHSEILEQVWLNIKDIKVSCETENQKNKEKQIPGGTNEKDVHEYKYTQLAEESFNKYKNDVGETDVHQLLRIDKVTEQVVAGTLIKIVFYARIIPSNAVLFCHSEILQKLWLNVKDIKVSCDSENQTYIEEAQIPGGIIEKDVHEYKYTQLAEESFNKYKNDVGETGVHELLRIDKVTEQVVAGTLIKMDFHARIIPSNAVLFCHSEILEQLWLNVKYIKVSCDSENQSYIEEAQIPGGITEKDIHDCKYTQLAEEAFIKYKQEVGSTEDHELLQIKRVTEQMVAGTFIKMEFYARIIPSNAVLFCHSEILEQLWLNVKDIKVTCDSGHQDA